MKKYNNTWNAKRLTVNFNHKQWRQDLAAFIQQKKFWNHAAVTKSKSLANNPFHRDSKYFEIFDGFGNNIRIQYKNECEIEYSSNIELINEYLILRK